MYQVMGCVSHGVGCGIGSRLSRWPQAWLAACLAVLGLATACDRGSPGIEPSPATLAGVTAVHLMDFAVPLHYAKALTSRVLRPIVLFATGDAGWTAVDQDIVGTIVRLGYPVAAFSARDYLNHLDNLPEAATPAHVGADYSKLIARARETLDIPEATSAVLAGFSRGAALSVIAAGDSVLRRSLHGVLVLGLGDVEEHVLAGTGRAPTAVDLEVVRPYEYLKILGCLPVSIIQSSRDRFLDASEARRLLGPDSERRRLRTIESRGHSFVGARDRMFLEIGWSLSWIEDARLVQCAG